MVRNIASTSDIRGNMADLNMSSPSPQQEAPPQQETVHDDSSQQLETLGTRLCMPLRGENHRAKYLMNRVATGEATNAEQEEFNDYIAKMKQPEQVTTQAQRPSAPDAPASSPTEPVMHDMMQDFTTSCNSTVSDPRDGDEQQGGVQGNQSTDSSSASSPAIQDFQMQMMLLEQQNKKRLLMARQEMDNVGLADMYNQGVSAPLPSPLRRDDAVSPSQEVQGCDHALQDHQMQLMLLEQQNKKRLLMARQEQEMEMENHTYRSTHGVAAPLPSFPSRDEEALPSREVQGCNPALQDHQMQLMLLAQQNKKRLLMARQETDNSAYHPSASAAPPPPSRRVDDVAREQKVQNGDQALQDYEEQLRLLNQQNKKRLLMAPTKIDSPSHPSPPPPSFPAKPQTPPTRYVSAELQHKRQGPNRALEDYEMQLMLLDQQKKKLAIIASLEQDEEAAGGPSASLHAFSERELRMRAWERENTKKKMGDCQFPTSVSAQSSETEHSAPLKYEQQSTGLATPNYKSQLMMLEQQNTKRLLQARFEQDRMSTHWPERCRRVLADKEKTQLGTSSWEMGHKRFLHAPSSTWSKQEVEKFEWLWKHHLEDPGPREKNVRFGQANTIADNYEALRFPQATRSSASVYTKPFCDWLTDNPTVFHAVDSTKQQLKESGWTELDERDTWDLEPSGRYFVTRNGSSMIAFVVGADYEPGNGAAILAGHVDALTAKLKPISEVPNKAGYLQLGVAPYAGGMNSTWWDRDLGIGGRVLVREGDKIVTKLVKLDWPIARIPTLAPHFGAASVGPFNKETQMVPIIGLEGVDSAADEYQSNGPFSQPPILGGEDGPVGNFVNTQPKALVKVIGDAIGLNASSYGKIINWELELFDVQPATVGGLNKEFIYAGRIDDKLCSWAAMQALCESSQHDTRFSSIIKVVGWFDNEEIGSQLRQGARSNFLPKTLERAVGSLANHHPTSDLMGQTYANSFILSSDVTHAVNPNFLGAYLENHAPHLNVGLCVAADSNGHMTTDAVSTAILQRCADRIGAKLQVFQIRNDSRSGGTVGPMLSSMTGIRAIDAGIPQLSMHSIRATTGSLDPGLGVIMFTGFLNGFERVDKEFRS